MSLSIFKKENKKNSNLNFISLTNIDLDKIKKEDNKNNRENCSSTDKNIKVAKGKVTKLEKKLNSINFSNNSIYSAINEKYIKNITNITIGCLGKRLNNLLYIKAQLENWKKSYKDKIYCNIKKNEDFKVSILFLKLNRPKNHHL